MSTDPFHEGERAVQARAGLTAETAPSGRGIAAALPAQMDRLLSTFRLAVAASRDGGGRMWASLLTGPPGFLHPLDERRLLVRTLGHPDDPLAGNVRDQPAVGLLAIDLAARRRYRVIHGLYFPSFFTRAAVFSASCRLLKRPIWTLNIGEPLDPGARTYA